MNSLKPLLIVVITALFSFTGGYSAYFLPQVLGSRAASTSNPASPSQGGPASPSQGGPASPSQGGQQPARARMWLTQMQGDSLRQQGVPLQILQINQGETLDIALIINANGQIINGVDSIISFDPEILEIKKIKEIKEQPFAQNEQTAVQSVFNFVRKEVRDGKIYLTAVKQAPDENPTNELTLATITLKGLKAGSAALNFDHFPGKTYGSTIIRASDSENILDEVEGVRVEINK